MKYFLVVGIIPYADSYCGPIVGPISHQEKQQAYNDFNIGLPKAGKRLIYNFSKLGSLSALVYDIDRCNLVITSRSQKNAYKLRNLLICVLAIFPRHILFDRGFEWGLYELNKSPFDLTSFEELVSMIVPIHEDDYYDPILMDEILHTGLGLSDIQIKSLCNLVEHLTKGPEKFYQAALHLLQSLYILPNTINASYYACHYIYDRKSEKKYLRQKRQYELQTCYDLAFLSAFRSIEAILECNNWKGQDIERLLIKLDCENKTDFTKIKWEARHLIFSGMKIHWDFKEIIKIFLLWRNSIAAHSPLIRKENLTEDHVFEIQNVAAHMLQEILIKEKYENGKK